MDIKKITNKLDKFNDIKDAELNQEEILIKQDKSIVENNNLGKKIIIEDGRQLLI